MRLNANATSVAGKNLLNINFIITWALLLHAAVGRQMKRGRRATGGTRLANGYNDCIRVRDASLLFLGRQTVVVVLGFVVMIWSWWRIRDLSLIFQVWSKLIIWPDWFHSGWSPSKQRPDLKGSCPAAAGLGSMCHCPPSSSPALTYVFLLHAWTKGGDESSFLGSADAISISFAHALWFQEEINKFNHTHHIYLQKPAANILIIKPRWSRRNGQPVPSFLRVSLSILSKIH